MDSEPECPECGDNMVIRKNRSTGEKFYGCVMYPQCDGTLPINDQLEHQGYPDWAKTNE